MNIGAKLTPGIVALAIAIGTLWGPLGELSSITPDNLTNTAYWKDVLTSMIGSGADAIRQAATILAAAIGIPMWANRKASNEHQSPGQP